MLTTKEKPLAAAKQTEGQLKGVNTPMQNQNITSSNKIKSKGYFNNQTETDLSNYGKYRYYKKIRKDGLGEYKTVPSTRRLAIKYYCLECIGFIYKEMANCTMPECPLFSYRFGKLPEGKTAKDRAKDIRRHCMECCSDDRSYIAECPSGLCPVHPFRLAGYKTDISSLIPAKQIENLPEYENGFGDLKEKEAV